MLLVRPMGALASITAPAVSLLSASTTGILRLLGARSGSGPGVSEEEIRIMLDHARLAGVVHATEQDIVERVFRLGDRRVNSLMTPRPEIIWVDVDDPVGDSMRTMIAGGHTYYPACRGDIENVLGMASIKEQWSRMVNRQPPDLKAGLQPPLFVPEMMPALKVLEEFKTKGRHVALVVDEYGGVSGLVTLNDVLEAVVGEVTAVDIGEQPSIVERADGSWLVDGMLSVAELQHALHLAEPPEEDRGDFQTVGGLVLHQLGRIPRIADHFEWCSLRFEVVDMDGRRIDKVLVQRVAPPPDAESHKDDVAETRDE
jgi:putative hemolysin